MPRPGTPPTPAPRFRPREPTPSDSSTEADVETAEAYLTEGLEPADFHAYDPARNKRSMTTGPNGEKRPRDPIANAVHVMRVATGEAVEEYAYPPRSEEERVRRQAASKARRRLAGREKQD